MGAIPRGPAPEDPWGQPFEIEVDDGTVRVVSLGPDGQAFTEDDIEVVVRTDRESGHTTDGRLQGVMPHGLERRSPGE